MDEVGQEEGRRMKAELGSILVDSRKSPKAFFRVEQLCPTGEVKGTAFLVEESRTCTCEYQLDFLGSQGWEVINIEWDNVLNLTRD